MTLTNQRVFFFLERVKSQELRSGIFLGNETERNGVTPWPKLDVEHDILAGFIWRKKTKSGSDSFSAGLVVTRTIEKEAEVRK